MWGWRAGLGAVLGVLLVTAGTVGGQEAKPSPASCCSNLEGKPLRQLNHADTVEWLTCNQIAKEVIETVKRERVVGYELSLMTQEEMMELLGMNKIHAWRTSRCKDVTDGTRRWAPGGVGSKEGHAPPPPPPASQAAPPPPPPPPAASPQTTGAGGKKTCKYSKDLTGKRCFGLHRAPDPAWTPASCKQQCCRRASECDLWLYNYAEGCWFASPGAEPNCVDEAGWFGAARITKDEL